MIKQTPSISIHSLTHDYLRKVLRGLDESIESLLRLPAEEMIVRWRWWRRAASSGDWEQAVEIWSRDQVQRIQHCWTVCVDLSNWELVLFSDNQTTFHSESSKPFLGEAALTVIHSVKKLCGIMTRLWQTILQKWLWRLEPLWWRVKSSVWQEANQILDWSVWTTTREPPWIWSSSSMEPSASLQMTLLRNQIPRVPVPLNLF